MTLLSYSKAHDDIESPSYAHPGDSGFDIRAAVPKDGLFVDDHDVVDVPTGLRFAIPEGYELQIRPRSGLSKFLRILNAPGTVDSGYRGEIFVRVLAQPGTEYVINRGDKIAQAVLAPVYRALLEELSEIPTNTARGEGGFGSTGR